MGFPKKSCGKHSFFSFSGPPVRVSQPHPAPEKKREEEDKWRKPFFAPIPLSLSRRIHSSQEKSEQQWKKEEENRKKRKALMRGFTST